MNLRLRCKAGQRLQVLDENGNEVSGVMSVSFRADGKNPVPVVTIECRAEIIVDAAANVADAVATPEKTRRAGPPAANPTE